jgi:hypothetical protein
VGRLFAIPDAKALWVRDFLFMAVHSLSERTSNMLHIEVTNVGRGSQEHILASCRVELRSEDGKDTVALLDARVLRNKKTGALFVGYPTQSVKDALRESSFVPIFQLSKALQQRVSQAVLEAFEGPLGAEQRLNNLEGVRESFRGINDAR